MVIGKIYHVVDDDLYVDFGAKFPVVVRRPRQSRREDYVRGAQVKIKLKSLEMTDKFLGFDKEMTLMEADGTLMGLYDHRK